LQKLHIYPTLYMLATATWANVTVTHYSKKCVRKAQLWHTNEGLYYDYICIFKCMSTALHNQYTPKTPALEKYTGITYIFTNFISTNTQYRTIPVAPYAKINHYTLSDTYIHSIDPWDCHKTIGCGTCHKHTKIYKILQCKIL
jgi:hypothetical protein